MSGWWWMAFSVIVAVNLGTIIGIGIHAILAYLFNWQFNPKTRRWE